MRRAVRAVRRALDAGVVGSRSLWPLLQDLAGDDLGGGMTYDAIILRSAEDAGATTLLTFNPRDYERLSPRIPIRTPE